MIKRPKRLSVYGEWTRVLSGLQTTGSGSGTPDNQRLVRDHCSAQDDSVNCSSPLRRGNAGLSEMQSAHNLFDAVLEKYPQLYQDYPVPTL